MTQTSIEQISRLANRAAKGALVGEPPLIPETRLANGAAHSVEGEPRMLIDGKLQMSSSGKTFDNISPSTEASLGVTADGNSDDMERAVDAARRAFDRTSWSTDHAFRAHCLLQLHEALDRHREEVRDIIVNEVGAPLQLTYGSQLDWAFPALQYFAHLATAYAYDQPQLDNPYAPGLQRTVIREAVGVAGVITPWNFPLLIALGKIAPALAAGCTVAFKPAPSTPWSGTIIGRLVAEETDMPPGVFNIVPSSENLVGEVLSSDPRVDHLTFTGSTAVGKRIMLRASETIKKLSLELGGKSPNVILEDADFATVIPRAVGMVSCNSGQGCVLPTRVLVPRSRYEEAVELAAIAYGSISVGDPHDANTAIGPVNSRAQFDRVLGYIEKGKAEGARLVVGGKASTKFSKGYYIEPTVFADVEPHHTIAREEIFGPVVSIIGYDDEEDAIRIANDHLYGLSGVVWSSDDAHAMRVARRIRSGTISVNGANFFFPDLPFGGYRQSGLGLESGVPGFESFLESKSVAQVSSRAL